MDLLSRKNKIILIPLIIYIIIYFTLIINVMPKFSTLVNGIFITALCVSSFILYNFYKFEFSKINKRIIKLVFSGLFIYLTINYILGLYTGYGREVYSIKFLSIIKNTLLPLISAIMLELFRYNYIRNNIDIYINYTL